MTGRADVTFISGGVTCAGYLYLPGQVTGKVPCVVMAHGFSGTRNLGLTAYAERFAAAGMAVLVFDYAYFGDRLRLASEIPLRNYAADTAVRRGADGPRAWFLPALAGWLTGGYEMADGKGTALARRSGAAPRVVSPRNKVNVALPLSVIKAGEPVTMRAGDWISLAGLVVSAIGFSVTIRELVRIAKASEIDRRAA